MGQRIGTPNVGLLCGLVATAQHHDQHLATLDEVHAPAKPEVFTHLVHTFADSFHVAQIAKLGFAQAFDKALAGQTVLQTIEPSGELIELFHRVCHDSNVIE